MLNCERASHLCLDDAHCDRYRKASQQDQVEQVFGFALVLCVMARWIKILRLRPRLPVS